ncbi:cell division protein FtsZ [Tsuneonella suprasediminis]|uniref:Cell division protein FtsZ n=1 Tax=Tsuneonella suprasediminis TaxID=2306996 RepID=A0A419R4R3_9SPHN|nr:cell division protein FtsZ [Tsuneonella suprasediminis]RJX69928.1 cell division protein FtsZ [Tsuneonella suprasediminis]
MSINIGPPATDDLRPKITVIGVGGAGGNAIANMIAAEIEGVDFIVANTDAQVLASSGAQTRIQLGPEITGGLGAGARPEVGKAAAEETVAEIEDALEGVNMCFIAAGMGGGTGTGAAPVIAEAARRKGVLTVGVVTKPFLFEGTRRMRAADAGIEELQKHVDTLIVIPNQNLFLIAKAETTFKEAFQLADEVLQQGVRSITDLMVMPGLINLDFADVRSVMEEMGKAMMGTGEGEGENRALEAAERAIANPLLDGVSMAGAKGVIISIIGGEDMKLLEVDEAANHIRELVDEDANIIWGSAFNPDLDGKIRVSVVATGIEGGQVSRADENRSFSLGGARPPKRPVLDLPEDNVAPAPEPVPAPAPVAATPPQPAPEPEAEPLDLGGMAQDDEEYQDDVDDIVDPLAGLRNAMAEEPGPPPPAASGGSHAAPAPAQDELLLDADRLVERDAPVTPPEDNRRRGLLSGGADGGAGGAAPPASRGGAAPGGAGAGTGGAKTGGSTLFERMANLSRGSGPAAGSRDAEDDDDDTDSGSLSIPRFLGRQNNQ